MGGVGGVEVGSGKMKREKNFGPRYDPCLFNVFMYRKDYLVKIEFTQSKVECTVQCQYPVYSARCIVNSTV